MTWSLTVICTAIFNEQLSNLKYYLTGAALMHMWLHNSKHILFRLDCIIKINPTISVLQWSEWEHDTKPEFVENSQHIWLIEIQYIKIK